MARYDHVIIGSGINALVCGALLAQTRRVLVLEREAVTGGTMRSGEIAPGFTADLLAATFTLFHVSPAYSELAAALEREGVRFATTESPTGTLMADGRFAVLSRERAANIAAFDAASPGDGARFAAEMAAVERDADVLFGLLNSDMWSATAAKVLARGLWKRGPRGLAALFGEALVTNRHRVEATYGAPEVQALNATWSLHAGLPPDQPFAGKIVQIMLSAFEAIGTPIVVGGAARMAEALTRIIERHRGTVRTGTEVDTIVPGTDGRSVAGVTLAGGAFVETPSVIASVTPTQLYGRLLRDWDLPERVTEATRRYRYGRADMQLHYALERPVDWPVPELGRVQLLHLSDGIDAVSKACNEAERGMLPERATVCVGQPTAADPSRAPEGKATLWLQLPECPRTVKGDAAGVIAPPADGTWTEAVREAYADRIEARIVEHVPGFRDTVIARRAISPADLHAMNVNLEGGDPYGGWCGLDQFFLYRPFPSTVNHRTAADGVTHIGASTHPGPGLGGVSGYLAAKRLG